MALTGYSVMPAHFSKIVLGRGARPNGLEAIRDTYKHVFNRGIGLYDVHQVKLNVGNNPIDSITTLVGPINKDGNPVPDGIIESNGVIHHVDVLSNAVYTDITASADDFEEYIYHVFNTMNSIVSMDKFYGSDSDARRHPYIALVKCYPLYFTYHHLIEVCNPNAQNHSGNLKLPAVAKNTIKDILERYYTSGSDLDKVYASLESNRPSRDTEDIYRTMTAGNTVELFL